MAKKKTKLEKMSKKERTSLAYALSTNLAKHGKPQTPKNERKLTKGEINKKEKHMGEFKKTFDLEESILMALAQQAMKSRGVTPRTARRTAQDELEPGYNFYTGKTEPVNKVKEELKNPKKADLNKDGKLSSYEKKRGAAIEKAVRKENLGEATNQEDLDKNYFALAHEMGLKDLRPSPEAITDKWYERNIENDLKDNDVTVKDFDWVLKYFVRKGADKTKIRDLQDKVYFKARENSTAKNREMFSYLYDKDGKLKPEYVNEAPGSTLTISKSDMEKLHKDKELEIDGHKIVFTEEMDINDPFLVKMRADKMKREKEANAPKPKKSINPNYKAIKNASKIKFLEKEKAQLMRDMEQEAEPEGGPIADRYGAQLNRIDKAIEKLRK